MTRRLATIWLTMMFLIAVGNPSVLAQDNQLETASLKGMSAIFVLVENLPEGAKVLGLSAETIQTDVELKLRLAGIRVVTQQEGFMLRGAPYAYIQINLTPSANAANVLIEIHQNASLERNSQLAPGVTTWSSGFLMPFTTASVYERKSKTLPINS